MMFTGVLNDVSCRSPAPMLSSFGLLSPSISPAILLTTPNGHNHTQEQFGTGKKEAADHPLESSFAINLPACNLPDISPIAMATPVKGCSKGAIVKVTTAARPSHEAGLLEQVSSASDVLGKGALKDSNNPRENSPPSLCLQNDPLLLACSTPDTPPHQPVEWSDIDDCPEKSAGTTKATSTPNHPKSGGEAKFVWGRSKRPLVSLTFAHKMANVDCVCNGQNCNRRQKY